MDNNLFLVQDILNKFLDPNVKIPQPVVTKLIQYVKSTETKCMTTFTHTYINWLETGLNQWRSTTPSQEIYIFILDLLSILCEDEVKFLLIHNLNLLNRVILTLNINQPDLNPVVKKSFIHLLNILRDTKVGMEWLITFATNWNSILILNTLDGYDFFHYELKTFAVELFFKIAATNRLLFMNILHISMQPLVDMEQSIRHNIVNSEEDWFAKVNPIITLITEIFEGFLENVNQKKYYLLIKMYNQIINFEEIMLTILKYVQSEHFILKVSHLMMPVYCFDLAIFTDSNETVKEELVHEYLEKIKFIFRLNVIKGFVKNVLDLAYTTHIYRTNLCLPITYLKGPSGSKILEPFLFEHQFLLLQLGPIFSFNKLLLGKELDKTIRGNDSRDEFNQKLLNKTHQHILHLTYEWRNLLFQSKNIIAEVIIALEYISKTMALYSTQCGIILFQTIIYLLSDLKADMHKKNGLRSALEDQLIGALVEILTDCIKTFQMTWRDSIETLDVMSLASDILDLPSLPTDVINKSLKLMEQAISKSMSHHLTLLIEEKDATIHYMGPLLYTKIRDNNPEVQKCALELLLTVSENAISKFPCFKNILLISELPTLVVSKVLGKSELNVKRVALKCLEQIAMINEVWEETVNVELLQETLLKILKLDEEKPLRCEAVRLVTIMYQQDYLSDIYLEEIFPIISNLSLQGPVDVRIEALLFWQSFCRKLLYNEGYIDHHFPTYTFSKTQKKIVMLDERGIRKILTKAFYRFSELGYLSILIDTLRSDEPDLSRLSKVLCDKLLNLLDEHKINENNIEEFCEDKKSEGSPKKSGQLDLHEVNMDFSHVFEIDSQPKNRYMTPKEFIRAMKQREYIIPDSFKEIRENLNSLNDILLELKRANPC